MRKVFLLLLILFIHLPANAETVIWTDGTKTKNCKIIKNDNIISSIKHRNKTIWEDYSSAINSIEKIKTDQINIAYQECSSSKHNYRQYCECIDLKSEPIRNQYKIAENILMKE